MFEKEISKFTIIVCLFLSFIMGFLLCFSLDCGLVHNQETQKDIFIIEIKCPNIGTPFEVSPLEPGALNE